MRNQNRRENMTDTTGEYGSVKQNKVQAFERNVGVMAHGVSSCA